MDSNSDRGLNHQTIGVQVVNTLRRMILLGDLSAERTTQDELAKRLGVSTMPIREALLRLAAEGFVEVSPNRSFRILPIAKDDISDMYFVHALLAGELAKRACLNADVGVIAGLQGFEMQFVEARENGSVDLMESANWNFHRAINLAARATKLLLVLKSSLRYIPEGFYGIVPNWAAVSEVGHDEILSAFVKKDEDAARQASMDHVREAGDLMIEHFSSNGYWAMPSGDDR